MKYVDEFRDRKLADQLVKRIHKRATRRWTLMEVCGGQTHGLLRHGIDEALKDVVEMLHGPGCPVCVTPAQAIDRAIELALRSDVVLASFGDMIRVPGSSHSLRNAKSQGADVRVVYSPLDAVKLAQQHSDRQVIFFAVGFETTVPATAIAVLQASQLGLENFCVLASHVRVLPAMELIASESNCRVQGFLAAGHVCTITGYEVYQSFVKKYRLPVVVTGFEPVDLLQGICTCVELLESKTIDVRNAYGRSVREIGNIQALQIIDQVFECNDQTWRGLGVMRDGGLCIRPAFARFDAWKRFPLLERSQAKEEGCLGGAVMTGKISPNQCPFFGVQCTPQSPLGAPMVSGEGICNAYFRYRQAT